MLSVPHPYWNRLIVKPFTAVPGAASQLSVAEVPLTCGSLVTVGVQTPRVVALPGMGVAAVKPDLSARTQTVMALPVVNPLIRTVVSSERPLEPLSGTSVHVALASGAPVCVPTLVVYSKPSMVTPDGSVHEAFSLSSLPLPLTVATLAVVAGIRVRASSVADAAELPTTPLCFIRTWNSYKVAADSELTAMFVSSCTKLPPSLESPTSVQLADHAVGELGFTR